MDEHKKNIVINILKILFIVSALFFIIKYIYRNVDEIKNINFKVNWFIFLISMLFFFVYKFTLASLWHLITVQNETQIKYEDAIIAYFYSILGKYIPGKVFLLGARIAYYKIEGMKVSKVAICFFIENLCTLLGAAFLFLISLLLFPNALFDKYKLIVFLLIVILFLFIHPKFINFLMKIVQKISKKKNLIIPIGYLQMLKLVFLFIVNWIIVGLGFSLLVYSFYPIKFNQMLFVSGIFALSAIIGILAIFAPSGIGVREGIIILGLGLIMPEYYAIIISVVSRLWSTIPELILSIFAFIYRRKKMICKINKLN